MRAMKDSGVEWIGEIPNTWNLVQLKRFTKVNNGKDISLEVDYSLDAIPVYGSGGVFKYTNEYMHNGKAVMFGRKGTLGNPIFVDEKFWVVDTMYYLTHSHNLYPKYNYYQLKCFDWSPHITHTALPSVVASEIVSCLFPFPPLDEQRRIADFLDRRCAEIDRVIDATQQTIAEYKALKQSIITEAVTKGVRGPRPMKHSGVKWIGEIPEEWECKPIKCVATLQPSCNTTNIKEDSLITYMPMDCLKNGFFIQNTALFGSVAASLTPFENGDIAMAKVTPCFENGNIAIMDNLSSGFGMGSSELFIFRPISIETRYLLYWLQNDLFKQAACSTMTGTGGLKRVSPYFAKNSHLPVPSNKEQSQIVKYLDSKCAEVDRLIATKQQLLTELESYKKSVIYEYVTGKKEVYYEECLL